MKKSRDRTDMETYKTLDRLFVGRNAVPGYSRRRQRRGRSEKDEQRVLRRVRKGSSYFDHSFLSRPISPLLFLS